MEKIDPPGKFSAQELDALYFNLFGLRDGQESADEIVAFLAGQGYGADIEAVKELARDIPQIEIKEFERRLETLALDH